MHQPLQLPQKEQENVRIMHDDDVIEDQEGVKLPVVYANATSTEFKHDERQITAQCFIH